MGRDGTPNLYTRVDSRDEFVKCRKCGTEYYKAWNHCPNCRTPQGSRGFMPVLIVALILLIAFAAYKQFYAPSTDLISNEVSENDSYVTNSDGSVTPSELTPNDLKPADIEEPQFMAAPVACPSTGVYQLFTTNELIAPFSVKNHTDNSSYLMKFISTNDGATVLTVFLNRNEGCEIKVPLGSYEILTASGDTWYGDADLFGPATNYQKYDNIYDFYIDGINIRGWYIDFTPKTSGNLNSDVISKDEFL